MDYLFLYNRGVFWTARYAFSLFITRFNRITRFLLDPFMQTHVVYRTMHQSGLSGFYLVQDVGLPHDKAVELTLWLDKHLKLYPLWPCPLRTRRDSPDSRHGLYSESAKSGTPDLFNFGVCGPASFDRHEDVRLNWALEQKVCTSRAARSGSTRTPTNYTEDEFWANYDRRGLYDALRAKYLAVHLPSVYEQGQCQGRRGRRGGGDPRVVDGLAAGCLLEYLAAAGSVWCL